MARQLTPHGQFKPRRAKKKCPRANKISWRTQADAEMAIDNARRSETRSADGPCEQRSYYCRSCRGHHTTSKHLNTGRG